MIDARQADVVPVTASPKILGSSQSVGSIYWDSAVPAINPQLTTDVPGRAGRLKYGA